MADDTPKEEKTEEATPRRRQEARSEGQVAFSTEIMAAAMLGAVVLAGLAAGTELAGTAGGVVVSSFKNVGTLGPKEIDLPDFAVLIGSTGKDFLPSMLLLLGPVILVGLLMGFGQAGFQLSAKAISVDGNKLNPIKGFTRMFSMRSVVRTGLAVAKISIITFVVCFTAWLHLEEMALMAASDVGPVLSEGIAILFKCALAGISAIGVIALIDFLYQRFQHSKDLRMTKKEIKEELKSSEGDPLIRSRIRQIQREVASRRMMEDVPKATVVVTNPTHYAVALTYDRESDDGTRRAPRVVAKGVDHVALRIREVAREAGVLIYEAPPLARALHAQVEIGDEIPEELFQAVAGVLAYVYRMQGEAAPV